MTAKARFRATVSVSMLAAHRLDAVLGAAAAGGKSGAVKAAKAAAACRTG